VQIQWLELVDFRSYQALSFAPAETLNILSGANGQGKTNLLEALGVLLVGRSFRGARAAEMLRWEAASAVLSGGLSRGEVARTLRRQIERRPDGALSLTGEGCPWVRAVSFGCQDLAIPAGDPQARRKFTDGFAAKLFPAHATAWVRYRQVLRRRNHLLQEPASLPAVLRRLEPWNEQLVQAGAEVQRRRAPAVEALQGEIQTLYAELGGSSTVRLEYRPSPPGSVGAPEVFRARLEARAREEAARGQTLVGPHRDDLDISLDGRDVRTFGSRGQQRVLALTLRLAEARAVGKAVGSPPVLLLDDALSELDRQTQENVVRHAGQAGQVFLSTAAQDIPVRAAAWWAVTGGSVTRASFTRFRGAA
jgi:DNA replication and repair protein RecF